MLKLILPGLQQMGNYRREFLSGDLSAGLIVAVLLIPQGMAYAMLAGIDPVIGLYSVTIPLVVYALFASARQLAVGPVAMVALLVFSGVSALAEPGTAQFTSYVLLLTLMVGIIQFLMGVFRLGFVVHFLSPAVMSGFTSAAAIVIALSQLKHLLGVPLANHAYIHQLVLETVQRLDEAHPLTLAIGLGSIILWGLIRKIAPRFPSPLLLVILSSLVVYLFSLDQRGVSIVGDVPQGFPGFSLPVVDIQSLKPLLSVALTISLVGFMESLAVAQRIASKENYELNANQELRALGLANIVGSFFSSMPVTGGFSRTAVNYQAGAKTVLASILTAFFVILTLLFFTPFFYYLPHSVLAAIIMTAVYGLIDLKETKRLFQENRAEGVILVITFLGTLFLGIEQGLLMGVSASLLKRFLQRLRK